MQMSRLRHGGAGAQYEYVVTCHRPFARSMSETRLRRIEAGEDAAADALDQLHLWHLT